MTLLRIHCHSLWIQSIITHCVNIMWNKVYDNPSSYKKGLSWEQHTYNALRHTSISWWMKLLQELMFTESIMEGALYLILKLLILLLITIVRSRSAKWLEQFYCNTTGTAVRCVIHCSIPYPYRDVMSWYYNVWQLLLLLSN